MAEKEDVFLIEGMTCASCALTIEKAVNKFNEKYNTNPFFSEIPKPNISQTAHNMEHFNPNYSFFGAFVNKGSEYMMGVPPLKYNLNSNGKFFEEEYEKFLKKYPNDIIDYAFNNKLTYEKENKKKEKINKQNKE